MVSYTVFIGAKQKQGMDEMKNDYKKQMEDDLKEAVTNYEKCQETSRAQSDDGWQAFDDIVAIFKKLGLEYNTKNLAKYGHKRSIYYLNKYPELED